MRAVTILPITGIGEIGPGDDVAAAVVAREPAIEPGDVIVVTQKVVSKAEGRVAREVEKAAVIAAESRRILRRSDDMVISETQHGFVCANAGVDSSNVALDHIVLLPVDPDASARRIRARIAHLTGTDVAVVISDTFGRAWRIGQTDVAIGVAGLDPFVDYRGTTDAHGNALHATRICMADEIAGAAELVMGKTRGICAAIVRGLEIEPARGAASDIVRPPEDDLFR